MKRKLSRIAEFVNSNPTAIREIMTLVTDYERHPESYPQELIYLAGGWPQDNPPEIIRDSLLEIAMDENRFGNASKYGATQGQPEFLQGIANYEKIVFGREADQEEVVVGLGSTDLTATFMRSCIDSSSEVIITRPSYLNYLRQIQIEISPKIRYKYWPIIKDHRFKPDLDELVDLISHRTRLIMLTSPGNPEGQIYDDQTIEAIADIAEDKGIWVMIDTAYEAFIYTKTPKYFFRKRRENEIRMCTFSKTLRVPGWRIAYAIADSELVRTVATLEQNRNLCPNRLAQESLSNIFQDESRLAQLREYCRTSCIKYKKVAEKTYEQLEKIPMVKPLEPQGGFYVFLDIAGHYQSSRLMCKRLLDQCQVALVPGIDFGMEGWVRLSFAPLVDEPEKISEGIDRIDKFLEGK